MTNGGDLGGEEYENMVLAWALSTSFHPTRKEIKTMLRLGQRFEEEHILTEEKSLESFSKIPLSSPVQYAVHGIRVVDDFNHHHLVDAYKEMSKQLLVGIQKARPYFVEFSFWGDYYFGYHLLERLTFGLADTYLAGDIESVISFCERSGEFTPTELMNYQIDFNNRAKYVVELLREDPTGHLLVKKVAEEIKGDILRSFSKEEFINAGIDAMARQYKRFYSLAEQLLKR